MRLVVVGAGAAGSLVLLHLARQVTQRPEGTALQVVVVDPTETARGPAFGTTDPRHLLNVPASGMSVDPDDRFDFVDWLVAEGLRAEGESPYWFAPRAAWSRYLRTRLAEALQAAGSRVEVERVRSAATRVARSEAGVEVGTADGASYGADALVLATGLPAVGDDWAPRDVSEMAPYVANPWRPGALEPVLAGDGPVLVVGTGLTMVDVAVTLLATDPAREITALSRGGRLPRRHADTYLGEVVPDVSQWGSSLAEVRAAASAHVAAVAQVGGDWRPGVDGLRYRVAELWGRLCAEDRARFVRDLAGDWGVLRHRMPAPTAQAVHEARRSGRLDVRAGKIVDVVEVSDGVEVATADGHRARYAWVVNATGPRSDLRLLANPVLDSLLGLDGSPAVATTDPLGLGLVTDGGRVLDPAGHPGPVWALGALRRGELWESTAVPEIRAQAQELASALLA